ncbi:hypothetical protein KY363_01915, partial [Candidatus Woesearchaeota archaeon]|nr:hypothetical protein [Candidatus Woesearchaeota archaeon]
MVGFDAPTIITALAIVFALYIISRMFLRKVSHSKEIEKLEHQIETEENDLKKALLRKKSEMQDLRRAIERADKKATTAVCSRIKAIIDAQEKELQKISSLDMEQVKHLRHLKIDTESMEGKTLADLVKLIEKEWGRPGSGREMDERYRALAKKDSHARGVGYLAMTFLHIHDFLNRIIALLDEEKRLLSGDVDINRLESVVS